MYVGLGSKVVRCKSSMSWRCLYAKARSGAIKEFTGISSPYEAPEAAELKIDTGSQELAESVDLVIKALQERGVIPAA